MAKDQADFTKGRMNKSVDERLLPAGEYIDAQNVRLGSTELSEVGAVENAKGNVQLTTLKYDGVALSGDAVCIGARDNSAKETMYWFVHDGNNPQATGGVVDMIVSFNTQTQQLTYHVVTTVLLNFNPTYLVNGVNLIDDLLFFTDNYNPPRKINVTRAYPQPIAHVDQITELDISVIKPQPMEAPEIELRESLDENYIEEMFICFSYRYKYKDGEYSPTSQFTPPAFSTSQFFIDPSSQTNSGMLNSSNTIDIFFSTGGSNVIGIDILFKEADSNVIYVARKIDKMAIGYQDDSTESIRFTNGDVYTILNSGEILRLYDNVPLLSKAQSIMGGRIMYGNYLEGRDMVDENGSPVNLNYIVEPNIKTLTAIDIDNDEPLFPTTYDLSVNPLVNGVPITVSDTTALLNMSNVPIEFLTDGSSIYVEITFRQSDVRNPNGTIRTDYYPFGTSESARPTFTFGFEYPISGNHSSPFSAFNTQIWSQIVGSDGGYQQSPTLWDSGFTATDRYNSSVPVPTPLTQNTDTLIELRSARNSTGTGTDPISAYVWSDGFLYVTLNAIQYIRQGSPNATPYYQIPVIDNVHVQFRNVRDNKSLHSNREYQVGIVYQDAEGRQSTVFESPDNNIFISSDNSENINKAIVTIPSSPVAMKPPVWADRYKFVMKQSKVDYDTIYSSIYYRDNVSGRSWIKLDGEQSNKLKIGDDLVVKMDSNGALDTPITTTILDIQSHPADFLTGNLDNQGNPIVEPSGVYAEVLPTGWALNYNETGMLGGNTEDSSTGSTPSPTFPPTLKYPLHTFDGTNYTPWTIPAGSYVKISTRFKRREYDRIEDNLAGREQCNFDWEGTASQDYNNFAEFWINQGVNVATSDCDSFDFLDDSGPNDNIFYQDIYDYANPNFTFHNTFNPTPEVNKFQFTQNSSTGEFWLELTSGTMQYYSVFAGLRRRSKIECTIWVRTATSTLVLETRPVRAIDEVYFENEQSFPIIGGFHMSGDLLNDQNQTATLPAIVNLTFFNCFSFFNGVESYKIKDSLTGKKFYLGNRVTSVSEQDYKEVRRESSITYSGVYNAQNNVNRLNEFNLGLSNYKDCENSYGPIQVLHGRRTDLLTLQEDRISYISLGKNLLVSADGQGVLTSVPEVLGTQIARTEEYGISENPESFTHYGADIYFTDAKRASVIQLKGGSSADGLSVISNNGMRSWFRDLFQTSFNYQKLGGYDPYMDEYVLSPNTNRLPFVEQVYECGGGERVFTGILDPYTFTIDAGRRYGDMTIEYETSDDFTVTAIYNGVTFNPVSTGLNTFEIVIDKEVPSIETILVTITPNVPSFDSVISITVGCPRADIIQIIPVTITSASDVGKLIHNSYTYFDTTVSPTYQSGYQIDQVQFISQNQMQYVSGNIVSQFGPVYAGAQGTGSVPIDGSDAVMYSTKMYNDTFDFDIAKNKMRYLRVAPSMSGGMPYENNALDIAALLANPSTQDAALTAALPAYEGAFTMPTGGNGDYLYLIWDYRTILETKLCYSPVISEACCECFSSPTCVPFLGTTIETSYAAACALTPLTTYYTSTITIGGITNTEPILGTIVYSYLGCVSGNTVGTGYIKLTDNTWVRTNANGEVVITGTC